MAAETGSNAPAPRPAEPSPEAGVARTRFAEARFVKARFFGLVLVCTKCVERQGLPKRSVRAMLKREIKVRLAGRRPRVVAVGCLGPCPKRALAVATSTSLADGRIVLLDPAATAQQAVDALLPGTRPPNSAPNPG